LKKRPITPAYIFFYIIFWPDTWRIMIGLILAGVLSPLLISTDQGLAGVVVINMMIACIGYSVSAAPARGFTTLLQTWILRKNR
jgi:hypothetical protein